jgi:hypothetical protein
MLGYYCLTISHVLLEGSSIIDLIHSVGASITIETL